MGLSEQITELLLEVDISCLCLHDAGAQPIMLLDHGIVLIVDLLQEFIVPLLDFLLLSLHVSLHLPDHVLDLEVLLPYLLLLYVDHLVPFLNASHLLVNAVHFNQQALL